MGIRLIKTTFIYSPQINGYDKDGIEKTTGSSSNWIARERIRAGFDGTDEGGRLGFTLPEIINAGSFIFRGDFSRRDMEVCLWESIPLHQRGLFDETEVLIQQQAVALENQINEALGALVTQ